MSETTSTDDWAVTATNKVVDTVDKVRDATTGKLITVSRGLVYGMLAGILGLGIVVLAAIALVRFLDVYLPESLFGEDHTWLAHLIIGLIFTLLGVIVYHQRRPRSAKKSKNSR